MAYAVISVIMWCLWMIVAVFAKVRRRRAGTKKAAGAAETPIDEDFGDSPDRRRTREAKRHASE